MQAGGRLRLVLSSLEPSHVQVRRGKAWVGAQTKGIWLRILARKSLSLHWVGASKPRSLLHARQNLESKLWNRSRMKTLNSICYNLRKKRYQLVFGSIHLPNLPKVSIDLARPYRVQTVVDSYCSWFQVQIQFLGSNRTLIQKGTLWWKELQHHVF